MVFRSNDGKYDKGNLKGRCARPTYPLENFHLAQPYATYHAEESNDCEDNPNPGNIPHPEKPCALRP